MAALALAEGAAWLMFKAFTGEELGDWRASGMAAAVRSLEAGVPDASEAPQTLYRFHPYTGYSGRPGEQPWPGRAGFNNWGFLDIHGREYPSRRQDGVTTVAVVGGSVAEIFANIGVNSAAAHARERWGREVRFVNLAVAGYKQPQQLFAVQYARLAGFEFDAILNLDGYNDVVLATENERFSVHPVFPSGMHTTQMEQFARNTLPMSVILGLAAREQNRKEQLGVLNSREGSPVAWSALADLVTLLRVRALQAEASRAAYAAGVTAHEGLSEEFRGPPAAGVPLEELVRTWASASRGLAAFARAEQITYVHALQPNQYVVGSKPMSVAERRLAILQADPGGVTVRLAWPHLREAGAQLQGEGVNFADLTQAFAEVDAPLYTDHCCHFNELGNEIVGRIMVDALAAAEGWTRP